VKRKALPMPSGQNDWYSQWFLLKRKTLPMPSGQHEGIANAFRSKWRHGKFPLQLSWNLYFDDKMKNLWTV
jgi:hypothetical protein